MEARSKTTRWDLPRCARSMTRIYSIAGSLRSPASKSIGVEVYPTQEWPRVSTRQSPIAILVGACLAVGIAISLAPVRFLLRYVVPDDAFYYLVIGRNIANGFGSTFDRLASTNGYHPLWMVPVVIVSRCFGGNLARLRIVLSSCAALDAFSVWIFYRILSRLEVDYRRCLLVTALFTVAWVTRLWNGPLNGLETSLNLALTLGYLAIVIRAISEHEQDWITRGVIVGLLFLARTDNFLLIGTAEAFTLWHVGLRKSIRARLYVAAIATAIALPWLGWCWWEFGSIVQVSGKSTAFLVNRNVTASWSAFDYASQMLRNAGELLCYSFAAPRVKNSVWFPTAILLVVSPISLTASRLGKTPTTLHLERALLWFVGVYSLGFLAMHTVRIVEIRPWYYSSLVPLIWLATARLMCRMRLPLLLVFGAEVLFLSACLWWVSLHSAGWGNPPVRFEVASILPKELPPGSSIGIFNAGTIAYFDQTHRIVNLDGLVNNQAYSYIKALDLCDYILREHLNAIGDDAPTLKAWKPIFGANRDSCFGAHRSLAKNGAGQDWVLYQVRNDRNR